MTVLHFKSHSHIMPRAFLIGSIKRYLSRFYYKALPLCYLKACVLHLIHAFT